MRVLLFLVLLFYGPPSLASSLQPGPLPPPLAVAGPQPAEAFAGHIAALRDPAGGLDLADVRAAAAAGRMRPVQGHSADFGYTTDTLWLRIGVRNESLGLEDWRLRLRENFFPEFAAWFVPEDGAPRLLDRHEPDTPFDARRVAWPELTVAFRMAPGTQGTLWLRYRSGGSSETSLALWDAAAFAQWADRTTARNFVYYGMLLFLNIAALIAWAVTQRGIFLAYAGYATSGLLFVMHGDGNTFRWLWPDWPAFNAYASIPIGGALVIFGANFARQFLQTPDRLPIFDKLLLGTIAITAALVVAPLAVDGQTIKKLLVLVAFLGILLFTASGLAAATTRFREVRFYVLAWTGALISSAIMTGRHWLGLEISEAMQINSMRIVLVLDAALMGLAILDRINQLRTDQSRALETALAEARRNLSLSRRLQDLERQVARAAALAQSRERQVADAVHDLRQPLQALRLNVQNLLEGPEAEAARAPAGRQKPDAQEIEETFSYLETLVSAELAQQESAWPPPQPLDGAQEPRDDRDMTVSLDEILAATGQMFSQEAAAKGLELRKVGCSARLSLPPLVVMRILNNLTANAIRYTSEGRILIGARRLSGGALRLEVHDTGPGLSDAEFRMVLRRAARLPRDAGQSGSGLGLAIVAAACEDYGLTLSRLDPAGGGASIGVLIPAGAVRGG